MQKNRCNQAEIAKKEKRQQKRIKKRVNRSRKRDIKQRQQHILEFKNEGSEWEK